MYVVYLANVFDNDKQLLVVTSTEERAKEYISKQMEDGEPTGICYFRFEQVELV